MVQSLTMELITMVSISGLPKAICFANLENREVISERFMAAI